MAAHPGAVAPAYAEEAVREMGLAVAVVMVDVLMVVLFVWLGGPD